MPRNPAYTHTIQDLDLPELLVQADIVRELTDHPGWEIVKDAIDAHSQRMLARLLNEACKPEDVPRLRGLGLSSMQDAADTIQAVAKEREAEAIKRTAQETANV